MSERCEDCARLDHDLDVTREALALCESALAVAQAKVEQLRLQLIRLQRVTGVSGALDANDIAELTGVGLMTVWQWKHRYPDFPKPIPGSHNPLLYERTNVDAFLERRPRLARRKRAGR